MKELFDRNPKNSTNAFDICQRRHGIGFTPMINSIGANTNLFCKLILT